MGRKPSAPSLKMFQPKPIPGTTVSASGLRTQHSSYATSDRPPQSPSPNSPYQHSMSHGHSQRDSYAGGLSSHDPQAKVINDAKVTLTMSGSNSSTNTSSDANSAEVGSARNLTKNVPHGQMFVVSVSGQFLMAERSCESAAP